MTKPTIVETGTINADGGASGVYVVTDDAPGGLVTVYSTHGTKATQAGGLRPHNVARGLYRDLRRDAALRDMRSAELSGEEGRAYLRANLAS